MKGRLAGMTKDKGVVILKPRFKDVYESNMESGFRIELKLNQNQRWYGVFVPGLDYWLVTNRHGVVLTMYQRTLEKIFEIIGR